MNTKADPEYWQDIAQRGGMLGTEMAIADMIAIIRWAKILGQWAHRDQKREDGKPYATHLRAVAEGVQDPQAVAVAWLHDLVEDCPQGLAWLRGQDPIIPAPAFPLRDPPLWLIEAVLAMTRRKGEDYPHYLLRVINNPLALEVKIADLRHNLSDQKQGNRKGKYQLALLILEDQIMRERFSQKPSVMWESGL